MILNVSGRTDVVAFYTDWFMNRYREGFVDVRNPFNEKLVSRIYFEDVDAIMFCTKNPIPIVKCLKEIKKPILFYVTITPYKKEIENNVIDKTKIIEAVKKISDIVGIDNLYIRYDPIFINDYYTVSYHIKAFDKLCSLLEGYTKHIIVSFLDEYKNVLKNKNILKYKKLTDDDYKKIGTSFSRSAKGRGITVQTCMEEHDLVEYGFIKGECLSHVLAYKLTGKSNFKSWKARGCNCVEMVDIGSYNTCNHLCRYCYANYSEEDIRKNMKMHDKDSSLLIGHIKDDDIIKRRR